MVKECGEFNSVPVEPGEHVTEPVVDSRTSEFARFAEESRARWDPFEWLKVKIKQSSNRKSSTK